MPDWNQEIKLSDLFGKKKRAPKQAPAEAAAPLPGDAKPAGQRKSLLKKEISFSRGRKENAAKAPSGPKEPKLSRKEKLATRKEERAAAKAAKAATADAPKQPMGSRRTAPSPVPEVPLMRAFNLLPREDAREARSKKATPAQLVLAVVALVALAALAAYFLLLNARVADNQSQVDSLRAAAAARPHPAPEAQPNEEADAALVAEQQARTGALAAALGRRVAWDRLLREFSLIVPEDVSLTKLGATGGGASGAAAAGDTPPPAGAPVSTSSFTIEGYTGSQESVARLLARLSVLPELSTVKLISSAKAELSGETVVQFSISATVKPVSGATP